MYVQSKDLMVANLVVIDPLPSNGRRLVREPALRVEPHRRRHHGNNGTIDRQGASWWSSTSQVSLLNTDVINPDSCSQVRIEDCYVVSGDDYVAIKSGWDEYGIAVGMPSEHIVVRRLTYVSPTSTVIALGSEMSGGIRDVRAEDITAIRTESAVRIKTAVGRGAYVRDVYARRMRLDGMKRVFWMTGDYKSHPDDGYDKTAVPVVENISYQDVVATGVWKEAARMQGIQGAPFKGICMANVTAEMTKERKVSWNCADVEGVSAGVTPAPCAPLQGTHAGSCPFPTDTLAVDQIAVQQCSYSITIPATTSVAGTE
uniref:Polygalacturonase n=1 Tax=Aegilops tauschii subsp. strangulata TaxID=200361 RepID=A0A453QC18_AEGTS